MGKIQRQFAETPGEHRNCSISKGESGTNLKFPSEGHIHAYPALIKLALAFKRLVGLYLDENGFKYNGDESEFTIKSGDGLFLILEIKHEPVLTSDDDFVALSDDFLHELVDLCSRINFRFEYAGVTSHLNPLIP